MDNASKHWGIINVGTCHHTGVFHKGNAMALESTDGKWFVCGPADVVSNRKLEALVIIYAANKVTICAADCATNVIAFKPTVTCCS